MKSTTTLLKAAELGDVKQLLTQLAAGGDANAASRDGSTALMHAVRSGNMRAVEVLLDAGADLNRTDKDGQRPLAQAMLYGTPALVQLLIERGADVRYMEQGLESPLMAAFGYGSVKMVEMLLAAGADVNARRAIDGLTVLDLVETNLRHSPTRTHRKIRDLLVAAGAVAARPPEPTPAPPAPKNALCEAVRERQAARVRKLLKEGAPVNAPDAGGRTALWYAANNGGRDLVQVLLSAGADPKAGGPGSSILDTAAAWGGTEVVRLLLEAGAAARVGRPLHGAAISFRDSLTVTRLLLEAGADPAVTDHDGCTPADLARQSGKPKVVDELTRAGGTLGPLSPTDAAIAAFGPASEQPTYRRLVERLGKLCRKPPRPFKDRTHEFRSDARGVFRCDFDFEAVAEEFGKGPAYLKSAARDEREARRLELIDRLAADVRRAGFQLVANTDVDGLLLFPTKDPYDVILAHQTNGNGHSLRFQHKQVTLGPEEISAWLRDMAEVDPFVLTACGHDVVAGEFLRPVLNARSLAQRMCKFCPDLIDYEMMHSPADVARELKNTQAFYFWWD